MYLHINIGFNINIYTLTLNNILIRMLVILIKTTKTNYFKKQKKSCGADRDWTCDPLRAREVLSQLSYSPNFILVVGLGRFELPTPALSERYSNQLSYKPRIKNLYYIVRMSKVY